MGNSNGEKCEHMQALLPKRLIKIYAFHSHKTERDLITVAAHRQPLESESRFSHQTKTFAANQLGCGAVHVGPPEGFRARSLEIWDGGAINGTYRLIRLQDRDSSRSRFKIH